MHIIILNVRAKDIDSAHLTLRVLKESCESALSVTSGSFLQTWIAQPLIYLTPMPLLEQMRHVRERQRLPSLPLYNINMRIMRHTELSFVEGLFLRSRFQSL